MVNSFRTLEQETRYPSLQLHLLSHLSLMCLLCLHVTLTSMEKKVINGKSQTI